MTELRYCALGCTRKDGDERHPVQLPADNPSLVCGRCDHKLEEWLRDIPTNYALLPAFVNHGTTDGNPESKATKRAEVTAPMRLNVIDLLDTRRGRKWQGMAPSDDRRGVLGALLVHAQAVKDERELHLPLPETVAGLASFLQRHRLWITEQAWVIDFYRELKTLARDVAEAAGIYRRPPVGRCPIDITDGDNVTTCNGPLFANDYTGVHCPRCHTEWPPEKLRHLGMVLAQDTA